MEKINLVEILKNYSVGTKLYSPIFGEVTFMKINGSNQYPITVLTSKGAIEDFTAEGRYLSQYKDSECLLFPSKDQRNWSKFGIPEIDPKIFKPFDKVLVRDSDNGIWKCSLFSCMNDDSYYPYDTVSTMYAQCIPYNEETEHLVGTTGEPPIHYKSLCNNN
ncbi:MAG: hypothetical protein ACI4OP_02220 [Candidatus Coprovivens sp.]